MNLANNAFSQCSTTDLVNQGTISPGLVAQTTGTVSTDKPYWQFDAVAGCEYTFTTCGNTSMDTYLRLYQDGAVGSWSIEASNDDDCNYQSTLTWTAGASGTYNILLTRWTCANLNTNVSLTYSSTCAPAPTCTGSANANDLCSGATTLAVNNSCTTTAWSLTTSYENCVSPSTMACSQNSEVEDMWFSFTATSLNTIIEVENTNRRMLFAVYSGSCGSLTQEACIDDIAAQGVETTSISTSIGTTYYVQVVRTNGDGATSNMNGTICVYEGPDPTCNDGIQNQGETGIDCGGPCPACPVLCTDLGYENMASGADGVLVTGWELMVGRNTVAGPYTIESPMTHSNYHCGAPIWGNDHSVPSQCGIGGTGVKVWHHTSEHHDIETSTTSGINDLIDVPDLPNFSGSNTRCIRLGGEQQIGSEASGMRTTITVNDPYLVYHYILRFEQTGHTINNRGFCTFRIKDQAGNILPCGSFEVYENGPGETWSWLNDWGGVWYMSDWKSVIMDMNDYIGQQVTIEVWVADCQEGAHAGWGYFDFECLSSATPDCSITPLPVELGQFNADCINQTPMLFWNTVSERNNDYFTIWHSTDGENFNDIGRVNAVGNSTQTVNYEFELPSLTEEMNYFYLSQTDYDGTTERFEAISLEECVKDEIVVYQDNNGNIHVIGAKNQKIKLIDATGKVVKEWERTGAHAILNAKDVSNGIYFIQIENDKNFIDRIFIGNTRN